MTTVAWDGKTLACDSRCCIGSLLMSDNHQKVFVLDRTEVTEHGLQEHRALVGCAGRSDDALAFVEYIRSMWTNRIAQFPKLDEDFHAIVVSDKGTYAYEDKHPLGILINDAEPYAIGSGAEAAVALMRCAGRSAPEAVADCKNLFADVGGAIRKYNLEVGEIKIERMTPLLHSPTSISDAVQEMVESCQPDKVRNFDEVLPSHLAYRAAAQVTRKCHHPGFVECNECPGPDPEMPLGWTKARIIDGNCVGCDTPCKAGVWHYKCPGKPTTQKLADEVEMHVNPPTFDQLYVFWRCQGGPRLDYETARREAVPLEVVPNDRP